MTKPFYVTTPIYYVNDRPHIGHAYTTIVADTMARFHRLRGESVVFTTGVDENSQKNIQAMRKAGESDISAYLDRMAGSWKQTWDDLGIGYTRFIRTTEEAHARGVERFWKAVQASGDIYEGSYEGEYCAGCESFKTQTEIVDGRCPLHPNAELQHVHEKNYFFRASAYRDALLAHLDTHPDFVQPESRRNEIRNYIKDHFTDFSISREAKNLEIGIPVPGDPSQRIYVWFDALLNYLTAIGYGTDDAMPVGAWPVDLQLVGKDIIKFHCALWPAMLMSAAKNDPSLRDESGNALLPTAVYAHGFFTIDGQKISKSLGNAIDPRDLVSTFGFDAIRYYMMREIPFGEDGDFSLERLKERYVHDLANTLGNLLNRSIAMSRKYCDGNVPVPGDDAARTFCGKDGAEKLRAAVQEALLASRADRALELIWNGVDGAYGLLHANKFIEETQPFKLVKTDPQAVATILYSLLEYCRFVAWLLQPMMPEVSRKMVERFGQEASSEAAAGFDALTAWGRLPAGAPLPEPVVLFPPLVATTAE